MRLRGFAPRRTFNTGTTGNASAAGRASQSSGASASKGASSQSALSSSFRNLDNASAPQAPGGLNVSQRAKSEKVPRDKRSGAVSASQMQNRIGNTRVKLQKAKAAFNRHDQALSRLQGNGPGAQMSKAYHKAAKNRAGKSIDRLQSREASQQARLNSLPQSDGNASSSAAGSKKPPSYFSRMYGAQ